MGGHGHFEPTKYHSIHEIPDELIKKYSKRDPNNALMRTRRWVNFKKKQILYQQNDGVPHYMRSFWGRWVHRYACWSTFGLFFYNIYLYRKLTNKK